MPTQTQAYTLYFTKMNFSIDFKMAGSKMKPAIIYLNQIISVYTKSEIIWYFHLYNATVTFFFAFSGKSDASIETLKTNVMPYFSPNVSIRSIVEVISAPSRTASFKKLSKNTASISWSDEIRLPIL